MLFVLDDIDIIQLIVDYLIYSFVMIEFGMVPHKSFQFQLMVIIIELIVWKDH